jgi:hypothetical protein
VANAEIILAFWDGTTCRTLVHELGHKQPKTIKELLNIATQHASHEEAIGATFTLGNTGTSVDGGRAAPTKAIIKSTKKCAKGSKKG